MAPLQIPQMTLQYTLRRYDGCKPLETLSRPLPLCTGFADEVEFGGARWRVGLLCGELPGRPDALACALAAEVSGGEARNCSLAVEWLLGDWSTQNFVFMPAAVYAGNRFHVRKCPYPPIVRDPQELGPHTPHVISDIHRLNLGDGPSRLELTSGDMATPLAGLQFAGAGAGLIVLSEQQSAAGWTGFRLEESADRTQATLSLMTPMVREHTVYRIASMDTPSDDTGHDFKPGADYSLRFNVYQFAASEPQAIFDRFFTVRKDLTGAPAVEHQLPFSAAWALHEAEYNAHRWAEAGGYYSVGMQDHKFQDWQIGWVGGMQASYPLLWEGAEESRQRALRNFEHAIATQTEAGFFWPCSHQGQVIGDNFYAETGDDWVLVRRLGDVLYFWLKQIALLERRGEKVEERWLAAIKKLAEGLVKIWEQNGQLGQFVGLHDGRIIIGGSASGAITPAGLTLAAARFGEGRYLTAARQIADYYYENFVRRGYTTGGPGEAMQAPDSESAFAMLESFVELYEATGEEAWLTRARQMAHQCASWVHSYDFAYPPSCEFGRLGMKTTGTVWANAQNKHSAPGICTHSGLALFKLYRATGELAYLELIREIAHSLGQFMSRADRPIRSSSDFANKVEVKTNLPGWMNERVNTSDWETKSNIGEVFHGPCWSEVTSMLTIVEIPGLYVQPDTGLYCAFDHVDVEIEEASPERLTLRVSNPTGFDAELKLLVEPSTATSQPLGQLALLNTPRLAVPAGQSVRLSLSRPEGRVL